jgi:signal transduction histidine kinase
MMRYRIRTKLILSYLLIVLATLSVSGVLFYALVKGTVTQQALDHLQEEGQAFLNIVDDNLLKAQPGSIAEKRLARVRLTLASRATNVSFLIVNQSTQRVMLTNMESMQSGEKFPVDLGKLTSKKGGREEFTRTYKGEDFLVYSADLPNAPGNVLIMLAPFQIIGDVMGDLLKTLLQGFLITSVLVLLLGLLLSRSLTRPVQVLDLQMRRLAKRDFSPPPVVKTGDELEEVSRTFAMMVEELKRHDHGQRRFLQNASHELKTPLMAIQGYAEGIKDGIFKGEEAERGLEVIAAESMRLKRVVDELIYLSKLETLEGVYHPETIPVGEMLAASLERMNSLALQKGVGLKVIGGTERVVYADADKLMQALINLLSNGVRHARTQVEVVVREQGDVLVLLIRDDGEGFANPEHEQARIFERFYKGNKGDTGLGLAITKAIVEKSGGSISAHNRPEGGAEFRLELPIGEGARI